MKRLLALTVLAACGGESAALDAGLDAAEIELPVCDLAFEDVYVERKIELLPEDQGRDIDGDGSIDNQLGEIAPFLNPTFETGIADGSILVVFALPGLANPPPDEPIEIAAYWPQVRDADSPPDPSNNLTTAELLVGLSVFDADCAPHSAMTVIQDGLSLHGEATGKGFAGQEGLFNLQRVVADTSIEADGALTTILTGAYPSCVLATTPAGAGLMGSSLNVLVAALGLQPDIDLDGDGLESFLVEGNTIVRCFDGDGSPIDGIACPCDPGITDGFSATVRLESVAANIIGTFP